MYVERLKKKYRTNFLLKNKYPEIKLPKSGPKIGPEKTRGWFQKIRIGIPVNNPDIAIVRKNFTKRFFQPPKTVICFLTLFIVIKKIIMDVGYKLDRSATSNGNLSFGVPAGQ